MLGFDHAKSLRSDLMIALLVAEMQLDERDALVKTASDLKQFSVAQVQLTLGIDIVELSWEHVKSCSHLFAECP